MSRIKRIEEPFGKFQTGIGAYKYEWDRKQRKYIYVKSYWANGSNLSRGGRDAEQCNNR